MCLAAPPRGRPLNDHVRGISFQRIERGRPVAGRPRRYKKGESMQAQDLERLEEVQERVSALGGYL
jgi:hypothetical protein